MRSPARPAPGHRAAVGRPLRPVRHRRHRRCGLRRWRPAERPDGTVGPDVRRVHRHPRRPVTVLPWGDHFALFATDATGAVTCAGGDPQNGLMGPWGPMSDCFHRRSRCPCHRPAVGRPLRLVRHRHHRRCHLRRRRPAERSDGTVGADVRCFRRHSGCAVAAMPWSGAFAVCAIDSGSSCGSLPAIRRTALPTGRPSRTHR